MEENKGANSEKSGPPPKKIQKIKLKRRPYYDDEILVSKKRTLAALKKMMYHRIVYRATPPEYFSFKRTEPIVHKSAQTTPRATKTGSYIIDGDDNCRLVYERLSSEPLQPELQRALGRATLRRFNVATEISLDERFSYLQVTQYDHR